MWCVHVQEAGEVGFEQGLGRLGVRDADDGVHDLLGGLDLDQLGGRDGALGPDGQGGRWRARTAADAVDRDIRKVDERRVRAQIAAGSVEVLPNLVHPRLHVGAVSLHLPSTPNTHGAHNAARTRHDTRRTAEGAEYLTSEVGISGHDATRFVQLDHLCPYEIEPWLDEFNAHDTPYRGGGGGRLSVYTYSPVLDLGEVLLEVRVESLVVEDEDDGRPGGVDGLSDEFVPDAVDPPARVHDQTTYRCWGGPTTANAVQSTKVE